MIAKAFQLTTLALLVDFAGTTLVVVGSIRTLLGFSRKGKSDELVGQLQRRLAVDLVTALSIKSGAGLIRTLTVTSWTQFGLVLAIIALRFFLGQTLKGVTRRAR